MFHVPEMILFDYGQTLADEGDYDPVRGNHAVLGMAVSNPRNISPEQLQDAADGIEKLLAYLHDRGIRTAVVSNMMKDTRTLTERIDELLPDNHFSFIMASSDYLFRKPHPRIFEMARAKAGLPADKIWYCGDNLICDVKGAAGVGMKPVWYTPYAKKGQEAPEGISYMTINHWEELIRLLELFRGGEGVCFTVDKEDYNPA